ncbi:hemicentin-2 isoform X1 [Ixodes scapularis]|uniref:hemicentin-2 isoform X1 n=2 Tax=Ixodes scapularis TaxID=6945 RepID=UPI001A9E898A|nr:hemicentin-2 isoform X1 [Ixodes scapularis]
MEPSLASTWTLASVLALAAPLVGAWRDFKPERAAPPEAPKRMLGTLCTIGLSTRQRRFWRIQREGVHNEITVIKNQTGKLYCNVTLPAVGSDENPSQIRWYKGAELIYMLTSEGRNVPVRQMTHRPSASWRDRLQVRATRLPIWLSIDPVSMYDQGEYYCLVYYGADLKRNVTHYLRVIEPPENVVIVFGARPHEKRLTSNQRVRQNEGEDLHLECLVVGGRPPPRIRWLETKRKGNVSYGSQSVLKVPRVPRYLDNASFTCEASNNNITEPLRTSMVIRLNLKPVNVSIRNKNTPLKAGVLARVECESYGSRPPPQFSWWLDGKELVNNSRNVENDLSILYFEPTVQNNGQKLSCISRNPLIRDSECADVWSLDVHFKPQITLLFRGLRMQLMNVTRGATVSFECRAMGNPIVANITWLLNRQPMHKAVASTQDYLFRGSTVVDILHARKNHTGTYSCLGTNAIGSTRSNEMFLRVLYEPECSQPSESYLITSLDEVIKVPCRISADPADVTFYWSFKSALDENTTRNLTSHRNASNGVLLYHPKVAADFGTVYCWAQNEIGPMTRPCIFHISLKETADNMATYILLAVIITFLFVLILVPVVVVIVVQTKERDAPKKGQNAQQPTATSMNHTLPKSMYGDHSV